MTFWTGVAGGIILLGLLVLVHEWGHFIIARLLGVRVEVFSIGFGPRLAGVKRGDTDYRISAVPLGGYVKMAGDQPGGEDSTGAPDEFFAKPRWQRTLIVLGGPTMNILTSLALLTAVYTAHFEHPAYLVEPARIAAVEPNSPAAAAGLQKGDRIVRFGNIVNPTWEQVFFEIALSRAEPVPIEIERGQEIVSSTLELPVRGEKAIELIGWLPERKWEVGSVSPGGPAAQAGLQAGDILVAVDGEELKPPGVTGDPVSPLVQKSEGRPIAIQIERGGTIQQIQVTPTRLNGESGRWIIGVGFGERAVTKDLGPVEAFQESVKRNIQMAGLMVDLIGRLFTGRTSLQNVSGPVGIAHMSGVMGEQGGWLAVLNLTILISLSLGILNLLPIPVLDGGHILFFAIEGVLRRDLSLTLKERLSQAALAFFLLVFVFVMYNDIARILSN